MQQLTLINIVGHLTLDNYITIYENALRASDRGFATAIRQAAIIKFGSGEWLLGCKHKIAAIYATNPAPYVSDLPYLSPEVNLLFDHADIDVLCELCCKLVATADPPVAASIVSDYCVERWGDEEFYIGINHVIPHIEEVV